MDWVVDDHTARELLMQYSEWLDVESVDVKKDDGRTHEDLANEFITNRDPHARPKVMEFEPYSDSPTPTLSSLEVEEDIKNDTLTIHAPYPIRVRQRSTMNSEDGVTVVFERRRSGEL
jgi:hypothetical protein